MMNKKSKNRKLRRKLSFVLFVAAVGVLMMRAMPGMSGKITKIAERQAAVTAWWGTLYPKFCFSQFPEENKGQKDDIKISFWLAQALDW
mgnify:FL=1